jgi:serine protease Do
LRARELKLKEEYGVEITGVEEGSPAEKAGLKKGDIVVEYQGNRVEGTEQFIRMVRETPAGRQVRMNVVRGGATQTVTAVIGSRKDRLEKESWSFPHVAPRLDVWIPDIPRAFTSWRSSMLGVEAESLEGQLAAYFGVKGGVLVRSIVKGSAAEKAGIRAGDVILRVDKDEVASPRELSNSIRSLRSKRTFPVVLMREKKEVTISVTLDEDRSENERTPGRSIVRREELDEL